jgi:casein kinase 1
MAFQVRVSIFNHSFKDLTDSQTEEFNKYLSYVRNLGFEDTPDYDYLRDLFTQALKNAGEVENGEYDWNKLNGGKGWISERKESAAANLHHANAHNPSNAELHGGTPGRTSKAIPPGRLEQDLPKPGVPTRPPGQSRHSTPQGQMRRDGHGGYLSSADLAKRKSGIDMAPEGSTTAQFVNSTQNLPNRATGQTQQAPQTQASPAAGTPEPKPSGFQKFLNAICCG